MRSEAKQSEFKSNPNKHPSAPCTYMYLQMYLLCEYGSKPLPPLSFDSAAATAAATVRSLLERTLQCLLIKFWCSEYAICVQVRKFKLFDHFSFFEYYSIKLYYPSSIILHSFIRHSCVCVCVLSIVYTTRAHNRHTSEHTHTHIWYTFGLIEWWVGSFLAPFRCRYVVYIWEQFISLCLQVKRIKKEEEDNNQSIFWLLKYDCSIRAVVVNFLCRMEAHTCPTLSHTHIRQFVQLYRHMTTTQIYFTLINYSST